MNPTHLHPDVAKQLELPKAERQKAVGAMKWIPYPRACYITQTMHDLMNHLPCYRMPNLLVVGDTGNGKTHIIRRFADEHPPYTRESDGQYIASVIYLQVPADADERSFYHNLLDLTGTPFRATDRTDRKQKQVINTLRRLETRLLIIDEIQHILAGNRIKQHQFLNVIKYLSNELMVPIIGAGIRTALNVIQHDEQLDGRFDSIDLPLWKMDAEYIRLLMSFERLIPLKLPSNLGEEELAIKLFAMSRGNIGLLAKVLQKAAVQAIRTKQECISLALLEKLDYSSD